jgi:ATP-dependent protease ClpP protease subunit
MMTLMNILILFLAFIVFPRSASATLLYDSVGINFTVVEKENDITLELHDVIQHPAAREFEDSYAYLKKDKEIIIDLNSGGGSVEEGHKIIAFVEKIQAEGFRVKTRVLNGRMCGSMCVPVFLSADIREAAETSAFMFHGVTTGWSTVPSKQKTEELFLYMKSRGLSESFESYLWSEVALSTPGEYWLTGSEMMELNSGVITKLMERHVRKKSVTMPFIPKL